MLIYARGGNLTFIGVNLKNNPIIWCLPVPIFVYK